MDIVGTFNHLIPSDQLEDSLLLGQNLECEASDEFASSHNLPGDSLKNMLSDKDPMFGSASSQFHLLENDDANFQISSSLDVNAAGFSQTCADGDKTPAKFPRGRRKDATQLQRKQTAFSSRGRGRGGQTRRPGPFKGVSEVKDDEEPGSTSTSVAEMHREKREELLSRRFNAREVYPSMNPVVVLRRLTVTVGGYKIELLPGPSHTSGSFNTSTIPSLSFQDDSMTTESNGLGLEQAQAVEVHSAPELNVIQDGANEMAMDLGPYVNPNEVQHTNGATDVTTDTKAVEQNKAEKPVSGDKSERKIADKKLLKPNRPLGTTKNKNLGRTGTLQKGPELHKQDKKAGKSTAENQQHLKTKPNSIGLKGPAVSNKPKQALKPQKEQVCDPVKHHVSSSGSRSPTVNRKVSSDSSPGAKVVLNKSPSSAKKPQIPSPAGTKPGQSVKDGPAEEEPEKAKMKKPDKILQRQKSKSSRSLSVDEPELFIPDNAPVVKKGSAEGDPAPASENETTWDSSKQCGLCSKPHNNRFMVGCGRCDDWFHGDCIGLDLAKVQQMEKDDQEFVCLKCCADEGGKVNTENTDNNSESHQKQGPEASVTAGGIRPLRKDSEERRSSVDSAPKSGSSVKHEVKKAKISPPSIKKPSTGQIRRSVRDSLEEILLKRLKESNLKDSKEKPAELAKRTEKELFALFQGVDSKYKNKYRSLMFNLRDAKNNVLFKRVLRGEIPPRDLVRMSAEELASKELAAWRQRENRHTIEMIEKEQREVERRPVTKITHKGEIEIENQEPAKAPEALPDPVPNVVEVSEEKPPESKAESPKKTKDTTSLHKSHLFDLYCKICTGRMAPPVEEATTKAVKVATTVIRRQSTVTDGESHDSTPTSPPIVPSALVDDLSLRAMEEGLLNFPTYQSRLESANTKEDTVAFLSGLGTLWNGYIDMPSVARYFTKAYPVSGTLEHLTEDLPETIQVGGRISPQIVWDYVEKIRASGTKEICVIRFTPDTEEDEISYTLLYAYFSSRRRYGVVANNRKQIKDLYLIPLGSTEKIPHQIVPFDGPGLETNRPNMLLGLIIRQRPKRDFVVLLPNEASEPPRLLVENKSQVDPIQKAVVARDEEKDFISSLGRIQEKDTANLTKSEVAESGLDIEDEENVSLRFLPGVLKQPTSEKDTPACDEVKNATSGTAGQTSDSGRDTSGHVTPKTPTNTRLDRFIIKKKDPKSVEMKQEPFSSNAEIMSSQGKGGPPSGVVLSLKDKPGDVTTETFLSSLSTFQPRTEHNRIEAKRETTPQSTQPGQDITLSPVSTSAASTDATNDATEDVAKHKTAEIPTKTLKLSSHGIVKKVDAAEPVTDTEQFSLNNDIPQPKVTQSTPSDQSSVTQPTSSEQSSVTQPTASDQSSVTQSTASDQSSVTQSTPSEQSSVTQSTPSEQSSVTQSTASDQSSVTQSTASDQSSVTQSTASDQSSVTQSTASDQSSVTQSTASDQSSVTQSTASDQSSVTQSTASDQSSVTQSTASDQSSVTQSTASDQSSVTQSTASDQSSVTQSTASDQSSVTQSTPSDQSSVTQSTASDQSSVTQSTASDQSSVTQSTASDQSSVTQSTASDQSSVTQSTPSDQSSVTQSTPSDQSSVTQSTASDQSSVTQSTASDQSSVTQSTPSDQSSVTQSTPSDQSSVTQSTPSDQSSVTQSTPSDQSSVTQSTPSDQSSITQSTPSDQSSVTQSTPSDQSSVTQSTPSDQSSVTQSTPSDQSSVTQSTPSDQSSATRSTPSDQSSATRSTPSDQSSATRSTPSDQSSATRSTASDQSSATRSTASDQSSATRSTASDQSSATRSTASDQSSATRSTASDQSSATRSTASDQSSATRSTASDQSSATRSTASDQSSATRSTASQPLSESAQPSAEFKAVEDIQTITTISFSGKNEGLKQSRQRLLSPPPFNTVNHGPPPATFPAYHTKLVDRSYHPGPVPNYRPQSNPAPFIPLHQQVPPPFGYPPPPPMMFPQNDPQNQMHAPPWAQAVPHPACFPQAVPEAVAGPPQPYRTPRFPDSSMLNVPSLNNNDQGSELWERKSRALADSFKKDDRDHYGRYKHKSQHYERERHKARSRSQSRSKSRSRSRSPSRSRHRHKTKHSREDRHGERRKERHHSSHHRDRDKHRRDSDHEKHKRDS